MGLCWTERYAIASRRRIFGYEITWKAACCWFIVFLLPSDGTKCSVSSASRRALEDALFWASHSEGWCLANRAVQGGAHTSFGKTVPHVRHTCITVASAGLSCSSQAIGGRSLRTDDPRGAEHETRRATLSPQTRKLLGFRKSNRISVSIWPGFIDSSSLCLSSMYEGVHCSTCFRLPALAEAAFGGPGPPTHLAPPLSR